MYLNGYLPRATHLSGALAEINETGGDEWLDGGSFLYAFDYIWSSVRSSSEGENIKFRCIASPTVDEHAEEIIIEKL